MPLKIFYLTLKVNLVSFCQVLPYPGGFERVTEYSLDGKCAKENNFIASCFRIKAEFLLNKFTLKGKIHGISQIDPEDTF